MANSNPNTSGENPLGISPDILFGMHTNVIMAWVFQDRELILARPGAEGDLSKVVVVDKCMPAGNYILLKVGDDVVNRPGFFQVPPPRRGKARSNGE